MRDSLCYRNLRIDSLTDPIRNSGSEIDILHRPEDVIQSDERDIIRLTMPLAASTRLNDYEILGLLGAGGMGEVYQARDPALKREVAIKVLPSFVSQDPSRLSRFEQEAQAAAALNHPNILAVYQFGIFEGAPYLVSELLVGESLRDVLQRGPVPVRKAIDYGIQIAHGLTAAHDKGIVHRDLKPENLFVTKNGRVKILDFGLAKPRFPLAGGAIFRGSGRRHCGFWT